MAVKFTSCVCAALVAALSTTASAQSRGSEGTTPMRLRLGPLGVTPSLSLTNIGWDTNVFNQADVDHPASDFTITLTPQIDSMLRIGRAKLTGSLREDLVYYQRYGSERSANMGLRGAVTVPFNRLTVMGGTIYVDARDRPGFEIDVRSRHSEVGFHGSVEARAGAKTFVGFTARRSTVDFERGAAFLGQSLRLELNRTIVAGAFTARHQVTPLTSLTFSVERESDRFTFSPLRDSNSLAVAAGVKFEPTAFIKGSATVGYRAFEPLASDVPAYNGATASVDLSSVPHAGTKLGLQLARDVQYSYAIDQPYYVGTGIIVSVMQEVYGPIGVGARAGRQQLAYRGLVHVHAAAAERTDAVRLFGGSVTYRLGRNTRVAINVDKQQRVSDVEGRRYDGLRFGTSVVYGF